MWQHLPRSFYLRHFPLCLLLTTLCARWEFSSAAWTTSHFFTFTNLFTYWAFCLLHVWASPSTDSLWQPRPCSHCRAWAGFPPMLRPYGTTKPQYDKHWNYTVRHDKHTCFRACLNVCSLYFLVTKPYCTVALHQGQVFPIGLLQSGLQRNALTSACECERCRSLLAACN